MKNLPEAVAAAEAILRELDRGHLLPDKYAAIISYAFAPLVEELDRLKAKRVCTICGSSTDMACSDCRIDLATKVFVCANSGCRDEHEKKCPSKVQSRLDKVLDAVVEAGKTYYGICQCLRGSKARNVFREALRKARE